MEEGSIWLFGSQRSRGFHMDATVADLSPGTLHFRTGKWLTKCQESVQCEMFLHNWGTVCSEEGCC